MSDKLTELKIQRNKLNQEFYAGAGFGAPPGSSEYNAFIKNKESILLELDIVEKDIKEEEVKARK